MTKVMTFCLYVQHAQCLCMCVSVVAFMLRKLKLTTSVCPVRCCTSLFYIRMCLCVSSGGPYHRGSCLLSCQCFPTTSARGGGTVCVCVCVCVCVLGGLWVEGTL